ncbi:hypothetical protein Q6D67_18820 [Haliea sp. E1-2-M8]|uniref:hypothetical protein n=1 Tax=Haliea sp. E1-2-M8 TaxID=3064706 RepID=UPI00271D3AC0|nr:hypothetical protein [Haliea sp. E1-2-M8]MDO8863750.1 hypothetical protein [Haliea sp. E1-2-M8]
MEHCKLPMNRRRNPIAKGLLLATAFTASLAAAADQTVRIIDDSEPDTRGPTPGAGNDDRGVTDATGLSVSLGELWLEYGEFVRDASGTDHLGHVRGELAASWVARPHWEVRVATRAYGYLESGGSDVHDLAFDYGESYVRYLGENYRVTAGAQQVTWGRIDEFPPTDRLSTQDISRYVIDDLEYRRRPSVAIRYEYFWADSKLDLLAVPRFRAAELPDRDSVWFPVNQSTGEVFGLRSTPLSRDLVRNARLDLDEPDSEGGFGARYKTTGAGLDYAITVQKGRNSLPYFAYDPASATISTRYPTSWSAGGDLAFEALGGVVRLEALWSADTPVTGIDGRYATVDSLSWGVALELFPGDGDGRLNLQLMGSRLDTDFPVLDRDETYALGGSWELPLARGRWRLNTRFHTGLYASDWYLNPELAYTAIPATELYLTLHHFDGSDGTPGGFHQDNSFIAVGLRLTL